MSKTSHLLMLRAICRYTQDKENTINYYFVCSSQFSYTWIEMCMCVFVWWRLIKDFGKWMWHKSRGLIQWINKNVVEIMNSERDWESVCCLRNRTGSTFLREREKVSHHFSIIQAFTYLTKHQPRGYYKSQKY